ncbi:MAG TPA: adenylyltransferase/cytidyltransferase family protein [Patescibacteria group bacterium]|nr:adenylyltransferase/cytidyltransferase family protein [Patescibacteria group bacterium]
MTAEMGRIKYTLLIGRWQPLHDGHKKLIQKVLDEGKNVCIAIRDTEHDGNNPFSVEQRKEMISQAFPQAKVIIIPDIEEVVYGRKVGWGIREIRLDEETEAISGTKIRDSMDKRAAEIG